MFGRSARMTGIRSARRSRQTGGFRMLAKMRQKAKDLLSSGVVSTVIGYGEGSGNRVRALFIRKPDDADKLILDERCVQNLAVSLTKREVRALGRPAVVARVPVMRTIQQLMFD